MNKNTLFKFMNNKAQTLHILESEIPILPQTYTLSMLCLRQRALEVTLATAPSQATKLMQSNKDRLPKMLLLYTESCWPIRNLRPISPSTLHLHLWHVADALSRGTYNSAFKCLLMNTGSLGYRIK